MYRILCYGDSNTWGYIPLTEKRYPPEVRWTGRLQTLLGPDYQVLEDGLSGRTTIWDDALAEYHNGKKTLLPSLDSQSPVDVVVLLLGTTDLKSRMHLNAMEVAMGAEQLIQMIQGFRTAEQVRPADVLLVGSDAVPVVFFRRALRPRVAAAAPVLPRCGAAVRLRLCGGG